MINFKVGNIFESKSEAIINTVNCEGKMGKGLAYQFKKRFPLMEKDYIEVCDNGKLVPGKLHFFIENDKCIINFPTKNKWREKSKMIYITEGLKELKKELIFRNINSVAIPPLGSGNGGLDWNMVKKEIIMELEDISNEIDIEVYAPSDSVSSDINEPKANYKTIFLLELSLEIENFKNIKLKQAIYLSNILSNNQIFISDLPKENENVKMLKKYYDIKDNKELLKLVKNKLISDSIVRNEQQNRELIKKVGHLVNTYDDDILKNMISELNSKGSLKVSDSKAEEILIKEGLIIYNLFNEKIINYLV